MSQRLRLPRGDYNYWDIETAFYRENTFLIPRKLASPLSSDGWLTVILDSGTNALEFLQAIYLSASVPLSVRMRAAIEALSFRRGSLISRGLGYLVDAPPIGRPTPILSGPAISEVSSEICTRR